MPLSKRQMDWLDDASGGRVFIRQAERLLAHDQTCLSLQHAWLPRIKGVSCGLEYCQDCPLTFYGDDGATGYGWYDPEITDEEGEVMDLCECCSRKYRG